MSSTPADPDTQHLSRRFTRRTSSVKAIAVTFAVGSLVAVCIELEARWLSSQAPAGKIGTIQVTDLIPIRPHDPVSPDHPSTKGPMPGTSDDD